MCLPWKAYELDPIFRRPDNRLQAIAQCFRLLDHIRGADERIVPLKLLVLPFGTRFNRSDSVPPISIKTRGATLSFHTRSAKPASSARTERLCHRIEGLTAIELLNLSGARKRA